MHQMKHRFRLSRAVFLIAIVLLAVSAKAQTSPQVFQPPPPAPDKFDWIQLKSGEWLKGELIALYEDSLEFDSDELNKLTLDWDDIRQVRTGRIVRTRFLDTVVTGRIVIDGNSVQVVGDTTQQFDRAQIVSIAAGEPKEISYWSGNVTFGFNLREGNSDQVEVNTLASARRRTVRSRVVLDYNSNYNLTDEITVTDNQRVNGGVDWFVTSRFFLRPIYVEYLKDPFKNFAHRWTIGGAAGYQLVDKKRISWEVNAGPAYQHTTFVSVEEGESKIEKTAALWAGTTYKNELTDDIDYTFDYRFLLLKPEAGRFTHHFVTGLSVDSFGPLDFDISFVWDRVQQPRADSSGVVPKKDDYSLIIGLGFDF
jgi:putative salt-induced outer membrane protein YdiY